MPVWQCGCEKAAALSLMGMRQEGTDELRICSIDVHRILWQPEYVDEATLDIPAGMLA